MYMIKWQPSHTLLLQILAILSVCTPSVFAQLPTKTSIAPSWPTGTRAKASSIHRQLPNGTTYDESNAIDGNILTKWKDFSLDAYPDTLTISIPIAVKLTGILIISAEAGWILAYTVDTYNGSDWTTVASIRNATSPLQLINFLDPVIATKVRINVTQDQPGSNTGGEYTRIDEIYPLFDTSSSSASNSTSASANDKSTSNKCSNAGAITGGVIGGVVAIMLAALAGLFVIIKRRNKGGSDLPESKSDLYTQELSSGSPYPATSTYEAAGEAELAAYSATPLELSNGATRNFGVVDLTKPKQIHEKPTELPNHISQNVETLYPRTSQQA